MKRALVAVLIAAFVVAPVEAYAQHGGSARPADAPMHTVTASKKDQNQLLAVHLTKFNTGSVGSAAGEPVPSNGLVRVLTLFPPVQPRVMPNLLGLSEETARARLIAEKIVIASVDSRVSQDSADLVVTQIPESGQAVSAATSASLTIGARQQVAMDIQ